MKTKENKLSKKFYKTNPRGISLIVLVITIIVIIILATAIIISLVKSNPISEANKARYESDRDNMQLIFTNTIGKIMAEKQGTIEIEAGRLNEPVSNKKSTVGEAVYRVSDNIGGKIIFDNNENTETEYYTGRQLPVYSKETIWHVDSEGILKLQVGDKEIINGNNSGSQTTQTVTVSQESFNEILKRLEALEKKENTNSYDINFPNKWPINSEIYLGNDLYGYRFIGVATNDKYYHDFTCSSTGKRPTIINYGGQIDVSTVDQNKISAQGYMWNNGDYLFPAVVSYSNNIRLQVTLTSYHVNVPYDIWVVYSK